MILVFIILIIIILINLISIFFLLSDIQIEVKKLYISNIEGNLKIDYTINLNIVFLKKVKIIKVKLDKEKTKKIFSSQKYKMQKIKWSKGLNEEVLEEIKKQEYKIEYLKLQGYFSTENSVMTGMIYAIINAIIPIIISRKTASNKYVNNIEFLTINKNTINIYINCIISLKIVNIINILHLIKKKSGGKNNGESSNRRSYAYSNE